MLRYILPSTLWGRFLLILFIPILMIQVVLWYVYVERHTDTIVRYMASHIASHVKAVISLAEHEKRFTTVSTFAKRNLDIEVQFKKPFPMKLKDKELDPWLYTTMDRALFDKIKTPHQIFMDSNYIYIHTKPFYFKVLRKHLLSRTTPLVMLGSMAASILFFLIAVLFMRNQLRPLWRLEKATEKFGRGELDHDIQVEGALEIRKTTDAFNIMRERLSRHMNERMIMLAGVSHDLRTPLTRMTLQLAMMEPTAPIQSLSEDVVIMKNMVEGFLSFARGIQNEPYEIVDIHEYITDICNKFDSFPIIINCPNKKIKIKRLSFNRLLTNIVVNSLRYAQSLWIRVECDMNEWRLIIDDDGSGIPENERESVFKPFYRLDSSRNHETGGTGLGLSIVRDSVHNHGGKIHLDSSPYGGLRIFVNLPFV
jgi:two-component system osmolarity sensor histidine kinase EnvZ